MSVSQPPLPLTHYCIDPQLAGVLIANMLESWLSADSALAPTREAVDEHEDHRTPPQQAGVHLYPPVDAGPGTAPSGEHRAPVRVEGQSAGTGLAGDSDPHAGPGPRSVWRTDGG